MSWKMMRWRVWSDFCVLALASVMILPTRLKETGTWRCGFENVTRLQTQDLVRRILRRVFLLFVCLRRIV